MRDILGNLLRVTPPFRGKGRLRRIWEHTVPRGEHRIARLPDGSILNIQLDIPYEQTVWLEDEEWHELCYLQKKLRQGDVFIDVGANIGLWTLVAASSVGTNGRVFSFEPNPATFEKLVYNVRLNARCSLVEVYQEAVSREDGLASFACESQHNVSAISSYCSNGDVIRVRTRALDFLLAKESVAEHLVGIKIDAEGHELEALEGAERLIEKRSPWLIVEFNTKLLGSSVLQAWSVYKFLVDKEYQPFTYTRRGREIRVDGMLTVNGYQNFLFKRI